ncbi:hypothetical protein ISU07_03860 [Nocardioides islandensis]|jgi:hypothetical protein|uniref:Uncharacterized protein n=1 Tax=Nocardioides islandensis TaxID=433663 RepID=A0A930YBM7_9ACTN|nr:hypothetical protein [Nocardioides islandensis]MBF4762251.1 hypothetical protein [Nocardioides islandensis]
MCPMSDHDGQHRDDKPISDQIKQVVDDLDLENKVKAVASAAEDAVFRGLGVAGQFVHERRDGIEAFIDRATSGLDERTGGKYAERVGHLRDQLSAGVASLADRRWTPVPDDPGELEPPAAGPQPPPPTDTWSDATDDLDGPPGPGTPDTP